MFDIITVGHFSIDFIRLPRRYMPKPTLGGPPTYVSMAAKNLGAMVSVISKVGGDFPPQYIEWLKRVGVDLFGLRVIKEASTTSFILKYEKNGSRQLTLKRKGPPITAEDVPDILETKVVHISPIANEISLEAMLKLKEQAEIVSLDPQGLLRNFDDKGTAYLRGTLDSEILAGIDIFKASQDEIEAATGILNLKSVKKIHECGAKIVIVTIGKKGAFLSIDNKTYIVPAAKSKRVIDTTGSGDVFIGAFLAEYIRGKDVLWCASVGSAAASFIVEKIGPKGFGSEKEIYKRAVEVHEGTTSSMKDEKRWAHKSN